MDPKQIIINQIEKYKKQRETTQAQVHMLEGAVQALEKLLAELEASEPIPAGPVSIKGEQNGIQNS